LTLLIVTVMVMAGCGSAAAPTGAPPATADAAQSAPTTTAPLNPTDPPATPADATATNTETQATTAPVTSAPATTDATGATAATRSGNPQECVSAYDAATDYFPDKVEAKHSEQWTVEYAGNYKVLRVNVPVGLDHYVVSNTQAVYVLVQCGTPAPELTGDLADATVIEVPIKTAVDGDDGFYAALELLERTENLVGYAGVTLTDVEAPYLPGVFAQMQSGAAPALGYEINVEQLAGIDPDVLFKNVGDEGLFQQIRDLDIPIVFYNPYQEPPLGSAEQVTFLSLFFNAEKVAGEHVAGVQQRYEELRETARQATSKPGVLLGTSNAGKDFSTRQNNYFEALLLADAQATKLPDLPGDSFATVAMESIIEEAGDADFWFHLSLKPGQNVAEFIAADPRAQSIAALEAGNAFHRFGPRGQDYSYTGQMNPDLILADLISILHPDLLPDHQLVFLERIPVE
jgi:iron complex transport system substrate-binding protein